MSADAQKTPDTVAQANAVTDERRQFVGDRVSSRLSQKFIIVSPKKIHYVDIAPRQIVGISAALDPVSLTMTMPTARRWVATCNVKLCLCSSPMSR
jgi:DNA-directed RNA polymerase beta subunit